MTSTRSPGCAPDCGDGVQRHGERLGERRRPQVEAVRNGDDRALVGLDELRERAVVERAVDGPDVAERGAVLTARAAGPARGRPSDDGGADLDRVDVGADGDDAPRPLVAADGAWLAPALDDHVQVGAADAAVAHLGDDLARAGGRDGALLDAEISGSVEHRGGHGRSPWHGENLAVSDTRVILSA